MRALHHNSTGFTVIEMLIAMSVFSVMLLIASGTVVQLSRQFYKGLTASRTQQAARNVSQEIINNIQFTTSQPIQEQTGAIESWCIANKRYVFARGVLVGDGAAGVVRQNNCNGTPPVAATIGAGQEELLARDMRLADFTITPDATGKVWQVRVKVAHGDDDILLDATTTNPRCSPEVAGSEFCAVAEFTTTVVRRL